MDNKDLKYYLKEIETTNSFNYLIEIGKELFNIFENNAVYNKKVQDFYEYFQRDSYVEDFDYFAETVLNPICEKYGIYMDDEPYLNVKFLVCTDIINTFFDEMCISDGLINAYNSISCGISNKYSHTVCCFINKAVLFRYIDYFLFDVIFNPNTKYECYKYAIEQNDAFLIASMKNDKNILRTLKIILIYLLKGNNNIEKSTQIVKNIPLNDTEVQILKLRKNWNDINNKATHKNIGKKLNPSLSENNVSQRVKDIKQKLCANSIDDAIRILESEEYNYRFER